MFWMQFSCDISTTIPEINSLCEIKTKVSPELDFDFFTILKFSKRNFMNLSLKIGS